jgi:hypothetical protein
MASPLVTLEPLLQICIDYLTERQAWCIAGGSRDDLPLALKALEDELNEPRLDWLGYGGWRTSLRLAHHLAGVRRQPTLMLCRYSLTATAMGLLAHGTGIQHFRLILGLLSNRELAAARLAAQALTGLPLYLAHYGAVTGYSHFSNVVVDHPLDHQQECELARNPAMAGATILSPLSNSSF